MLTANKTTITVGEEIELTIRAELLDIPPSLFFFFEDQKSFSLKLLLPDGFEITGGTYTDFIGATLDLQSKPAVEYTVKGKFIRYSPEPFTLLRGPKDVSTQSLFEKKAELVLDLQPVCTLEASQVRVYEPVAGVLVIEVPENPTSYVYSLDNITFYPTNFFPRNPAKSGTVYVREKQNAACVVAVNYSFAQSKPIKGAQGATPQGATPLSDSPCDDPSAKPIVTDAGGVLTVYNCLGTPLWLREGIYLSPTLGQNTIIACNSGGNGTYTVSCNTGSGGCADQSSDPVYVSSCVTGPGEPGGPGGPGGPGTCTNTQPQWEDVGGTQCIGKELHKLQEDKNSCSATFGQQKWVLVDPCGCNNFDNWQDTGNTRCSPDWSEWLEKEQLDLNTCSPTGGQTRWVIKDVCGCFSGATWTVTGETRCENGIIEREELDISGWCSPTYAQVRWISTGQCCDNQPRWETTGAIRCDASTGYQEQREERDNAGCSPTSGQFRWITTGQTCPSPPDWQGTGAFRCDASTNYQQEYEERDIAQGSPTYNQTRWIPTGQSCIPGANWQNTGNLRCDGSTNYQQEREERDIAQGSPTYDQTRWIPTGQTCVPGADWQNTGNFRCDGSTNYQQEREERDVAQGSPSFDQIRWIGTGQTCVPGANWQSTGNFRCDGSTNYQQEREERDVAQGSPTYDQTHWIPTGQSCTPGADWQGTGAFRCDASTNYQQEREERDVAQGSPSFDQIRWIGTGQTCVPGANWQSTGNFRCDGSTNYQQEREERDFAQGSPTFDQTRWVQTGQTCTPGADWQGTGAFRCDGSTNYQQEREERDIAQGSPTYDQTRWIGTGQTCVPGANWQSTGNFRCDGSTNYQQEREERDFAQGSPTFDQTRWVQTGQTCTPGADWQGTGAFRCDASTNFQQEREERDLAQGSSTFDQTRWVQTGQTCTPGADWQGTGAFRCDGSTNYQQEREERDVAQGSPTYDQTRWVQTGQTCTPGSNWQETGNLRCDASTNYQQEREERDIDQGSPTYDQTRWIGTGQTCMPGADWQGTGNFRCDASTNYQQEREERDVVQGSSTYDQIRWIQTGQTCTPGADWQGTGNFRCDGSTNYQQEREERDVAQGSPSFDQTRWGQTGQTCTPGADWQSTGAFRCDGSTNYQQEREEKDIATGSSTYNQTRWTQTGQTCTPGGNWQTTGNVRCNPTANRLEREEQDMATGSATYNETRWILTTDCCPISAPTVSALPAAISGPQTVTLTASGCAFQVEWSGPGGTSTGVVLMVTLSQTTTFTARCIDNNCQSPTAAVTVQRITVPAPIIRTNGTALCQGDTLQLDADGCEGQVHWSNGMMGNRIRFVPTATTTYSATCVVSNVASEASNAIGILVQTAPTGASATTGQTSYTTGQTISLSATAAGATRYEWSGPGGFMVTGQSVSRPTATVGMSGSYTVRAYSGAACPAVATVSVTVQPSENCTLAFDGEPRADCDFSAADTTRRGRITVKTKNAYASGQLQIALYQPVANGGYQLTSILPNSPAVFTGLKEGTYRIDAYEVTGSDTCRAGSRLVTVACDTTVSGCNIRIKAVDSQETETDVLPRVGGVLQPLTLSVEHLDGASLVGYSYQWTRTTGTGAAVSLGTSPTLSATAIGEYAVKLMSGTDTCVAYLTVRSKPCTPRTHTYACGNTPAIPLPDTGSRLSNLAPGDTIRAADFDIIVTEVTGGGSEGWRGVGYTEIPYLQGSRIAIELTGVVVNDCYELVGGTAVSVYDPSSFGTVDAGSLVNVFDALEQTYQEVQEFLRVYNGSSEDKAKLSAYIDQLESLKQTITQSENLQSDTKSFYENLIDNGRELLQCPLSATSSAGGRLSATQMTNTCSFDDLQAQFDQQKEQLAQNAWVNLPDGVPVNELSFEECISRISYKELTNTLPGGDEKIKIHVLSQDGSEVTAIIATIRGSFYRFTYNNVEYYYAKTLPECTNKKIVLVHQYGDNSVMDGIFSYYDYAGKKYVPFFPKGYPDQTIGQMVHHYSRGFNAFADVTEQVFVNTLIFIGGGGPVGGRIAQAVEWLAFSAEQYAALQAPNWKNTPEGEYYEKANVALLFFQLGTSINEIRELKNLPDEVKEAAEEAKKLLDEGEVDRILQESLEYSNTLPADNQFRLYMERLMLRIEFTGGKILRANNWYWTNRTGTKMFWRKMSNGEINSNIVQKLNGSSPGAKFEAQLANKIKELGFEDLTDFANIVKTQDKSKTLGDMDVATPNRIFEAKSSLTHYDDIVELGEQMDKYINPLNVNYFNQGQKQLVVVIGDLGNYNLSHPTLVDLQNKGVKIVIGLDNLISIY
ncbi:hypothetical protein [Larkinella sp.]|uniref:hypothetical protein n=1 Tax=Larkinella sp. TaxID=2034517 RepID=UPI003BAA1407